MVSPSRRTTGQAGGATTTRSLLTWTLLLLSVTAGQSKVNHYVPSKDILRSATVENDARVSRRPDAGSSPAEIPLLKNDLHTQRLRSPEPEPEHTDLKKYQDAAAPAREISAVRAPLGQSAESSRLTAIHDARPLQDWEADDIILFSTIDGSLHARDRKSGQHRWTLDMSEDPMIHTIHYPQDRSYLDDSAPESPYMFIVEPSNKGQLYAQFMDPTIGLQRLAVTVKKMADEAPFNMQVNGQRLVTSSHQTAKAYTIDASNGEILTEFPRQRADYQPRCRRRNDLELEDPACKPGRTIRLGRSVYTFTISSEQTGQDLCTIRFSEWVTNKGDIDLQRQYSQSLDGLDIQNYHNGKFTFFDGRADPDRPYKFTDSLTTPVAQIFDIIRSRDDRDDSADLVLLSRPMDLPFMQPEVQSWRDRMKMSQKVFIDKTPNGSWYAMSDSLYPGFTFGAPLAKIGWSHDGSPLDLHGDLDEIIGVHVLNGQQPLRPSERLTLPPPPPPPNENNNLIGDGKQRATQELSQPPAIIDNNVDAKIWRSGLLGVILGGIVVLLFTSKFNRFNVSTLPKTVRPQAVEAVVVNSDTPVSTPPEKVATADNAEQDWEIVTAEGVQTVIRAEPTLDESTSTAGHSRVQSATSVGSTKKKSVRIGDRDDNNSTDAESDDDDGSNEVGSEETPDQATADSSGAQPKKSKTKRGKRGGRKNNRKKKSVDPANFDEKAVVSLEQHLDNGMVQVGRLKIDLSEEKCLGRGSNGTAVYPGILDGREVAVKRLIKSANNLAEKEIKHLVSSDENQHVIRYFGKEESRDFFYIALDQFTTSLDQFIEHPERFPNLVDETQGFDVKDCLKQITDGVQHLHSLKLVHRDIKPQNVLVRAVKSNRPATGMPRLQFVISDFGLCKPLEDGAMSTFAPTANHTAAGTTGWRAPELLVNPRDAIAAPNAESSNSRTASTTHSLDGTAIDPPTGRRATKAIDIFSLGCVFYYVMTRGGHPFDVGGSSLGRDLNIKENNFTTDLMRFHKYEYDAEDLIMQMINHQPRNRPDTVGVLKHPYFWNPEQKLEFVCLVSDCYEKEKNSVTDIHAKGTVTRTPAEAESLVELAALEALAPNVIGLNSKREIRDFLQALPRTFLHGMGKQRSYTGTRMIDLLRLIRNKKNHFRDLPEEVQALILAKGGSQEEGYYSFWAERFPALLINCHANIVERQLTERFRLERWYA